MHTRKASLVFFGTPAFALAQLEAIYEAGYPVKAIVTATDKPQGRGRKLMPSAVKQFGLAHDIKVLQPAKLKDEHFLKELKLLDADIFVVVAFRMLPPAVWKMPRLGTFNLHASLLPQYRGAAPINRAIMNGEKSTGLTTFFINEHIDTGSIILQQAMDIEPDETAGQLHDRMMESGKALVIDTLEQISSGRIRSRSQQEIVGQSAKLKAAPKIFREDCRIDWTKRAEEIHNHIRGLSPYPAAFTTMISPDGKQFEVKILAGRHVYTRHNQQSFDLITDNKGILKVSLTNGFYHIHRLQFPGRKAMLTEEFLRGHPFQSGWKVV